MDNINFEGIQLTPLKQISTDKGAVYHGLKSSEDSFKTFGEAYFSCVDQNAIKGWKKHLDMTLNLIVPIGEILFVIYDENKNKFQEYKIGNENYQRLTIPPGFWVAFKGISKSNMLLNIASIEHDPSEAINCPINEIVYEW